MCRIGGDNLIREIPFPGEDALDEPMEESWDLSDFGAQYTAQEFIDAVNGEAAALPTGDVSLAARVAKRRGEEHLLAVERERAKKRRAEVDVEYTWLEDNRLFNGEPPEPGESWDQYQARMAEGWRVRNEERRRVRRARYLDSDASAVASHYRFGYDRPVGSNPVEVEAPVSGVSSEAPVPSVYNGVPVEAPSDMDIEEFGLEAGPSGEARPIIHQAAESVGIGSYNIAEQNPFSKVSVAEMVDKTQESPFHSRLSMFQKHYRVGKYNSS